MTASLRSRAARARWIAGFDIEPLMSAILRNGMLISMGLIAGSLVVQWVQTGRLNSDYVLQGDSIPVLIQRDFQQMNASNFWPDLLIDLGISALMLISYVRVLVSMLYFAYVDRDRSNFIFTAVIFVILTIVLLTTIA